MNLSRFLVPTLKEVPAEATITSHQLMLRAGLIRKLAAGVYSWLPLGARALKKLEALVRAEMDRAGAQEYILPHILPRELWEETGRYAVMGDLMMKVKDRGANDFVLGPTHEEAFTHVVRGELRSWRDLPMTVYQIGRKYRDEIRPRFGVMRGREFTMKDAYSYDRDQAGLDASYMTMRAAYKRIFARAGLETVSVRADAGAMGGSGSEEFMVPSQVGEDEIIVCRACGYAANTETAACRDDLPRQDELVKHMEEVATPGVRTIEELAAFFKTEPYRFLKSLLYQARTADGLFPVLAVIRGDLEINDVKLANAVGAIEVFLADDATVRQLTGAPTGFAGPVGATVRVLADESVRNLVNGITGANKADTHLTGVAPGRDFTPERYADLRRVKAGDGCPECAKQVESFRGIEVGHIFKLGTKYTESMRCVFLDEQGAEQFPVMGCYGIGVDRTLASVIEQTADADGIAWPASIAPFDVALVPVNLAHAETKAAADSIYAGLWAAGVEVLQDDRDARPGVKFKDADLVGLPVRVTVGEKGLVRGIVEVRVRKTGVVEEVPLDQAVARVRALVGELKQALA